MTGRMPLVVIMAALAGCHANNADDPKPLVEVKVARAVESDVSIVVRAPATVFPREQANVAPRLTAPVLELTVRKGDSVSAGQVLARLENRDLLAQRAEAAAALADAEASFAKISAGAGRHGAGGFESGAEVL